LRSKPDGINPCTVRVPHVAEQVERIGEQGCACHWIRGQRLAQQIDRPDVWSGECVAVLARRSTAGSGRAYRQITENPLARWRSQNGCNDIGLFQKPLVVNEHKEKRLVLLDRSADAAAELVAVLIVFLCAYEILEESLGREPGIVVGVEQGTCAEPRPSDGSMLLALMRTSSTISGLV
jgi:hypothetical protein